VDRKSQIYNFNLLNLSEFKFEGSRWWKLRTNIELTLKLNRDLGFAFSNASELGYWVSHSKKDSFLSKTVCKTCGGPVKFRSLSEGYQNFCSNKCSTSNPDTQHKKNKTSLGNSGWVVPTEIREYKEKASKRRKEVSSNLHYRIKREGCSESNYRLISKEKVTEAVEWVLSDRRYLDLKQYSISKGKPKGYWWELYFEANSRFPAAFLNVAEIARYVKLGKEVISDAFCRCGKRNMWQDSVVGWRRRCSNECRFSDSKIYKTASESYKKSMVRRYGVDNYFASDEWKTQRPEIMKEKYGKDHHLKVPEIRDRILSKQRETFKNNGRYGLYDYSIKSSIGERSWLSTLGIPEDPEHRQYYIEEALAYVDGYEPETNTVYEYLGNYWHGHPATNPGRKKDLDATVVRFEKLRSLGYVVKFVWESDFESGVVAPTLYRRPEDLT